jgi:flagellar protein FlaG
MNIHVTGGGTEYPSMIEKPKAAVNSEKASTHEAVKTTKETPGTFSISEEQLTRAINRAIKAMEGTSTTLNFSIHEATKHIIVKVLNKETGEVIREIPQEKNLDFLARVWEMAGTFVDKRI